MNPGIPFILLKKATSTNDIGMKLDMNMPLMAIISESQKNGKGRFRERVWFSPENSGLYMSIVINDMRGIQADSLGYFTKISALSVIQTLKEYTEIDGFRLKEPNDIYFSERKISGVLCESQTKGSSVLRIVCGIGLNILRPDEITEDIKDKAVYISDILPENVDYKITRDNIAEKITVFFIDYLEHIRKNNYLSIDEKFREFMI